MHGLREGSEKTGERQCLTCATSQTTMSSREELLESQPEEAAAGAPIPVMPTPNAAAGYICGRRKTGGLNKESVPTMHWVAAGSVAWRKVQQ